MRYFFPFPALARLSVAAVVGLAGCTAKESVEPVEPCSLTATVRLCYGKTLVCPTEHTSLELADGTRIRATGKVWEAYLPQQVDGQVLRISYVIIPRPATSEPGYTYATLTCLEGSVGWCGTR